MILTLPYPPSNNRYYRHARGRTYLSDAGSEYRLHVLSARPRTGWPITGRLMVHIEVHPPTKTGQDLDNIPKAVLDSLQHAKIILNDSDIDYLLITRQEKFKGGKLIVRIEQMAIDSLQKTG